jgi:hypothetical protein
LFQHRYEGGFDDVLRMKPDLLFVLHGADDTKRALIIDTKWKRLPVGPARPANSDLYQLYAYLRRYDCERAFLLYPKVEGVVIRDLAAMAGAKDADVGTVGVRCVELGHKLWTTTGRAALADELESIVRSGFGLPPSTTKEVAA